MTDKEVFKNNSHSMSSRGSKTERYEWSQTMSEATVTIHFPQKVSSKELEVTTKKDHLSVKLKKATDYIIHV